MAQSSSARADAPEQVLELTRVFAAPRELVFRMWTRPEFLVRWWGPEGLYLTRCEIDFRVGGTWRYAMQSVGGSSYPIRGEYTEIAAPSRLAFTYGPDEPDGFMTLVEIDFIARGDETEMRFRQAPFTDAGMRDAHGMGWMETFGLLAGYVEQARAGGADLVGRPRSERTAPDIAAALARLAAGRGSPEAAMIDRINRG